MKMGDLFQSSPTAFGGILEVLSFCRLQPNMVVSKMPLGSGLSLLIQTTMPHLPPPPRPSLWSNSLANRCLDSPPPFESKQTPTWNAGACLRLVEGQLESFPGERAGLLQSEPCTLP